MFVFSLSLSLSLMLVSRTINVSDYSPNSVFGWDVKLVVSKLVFSLIYDRKLREKEMVPGWPHQN